MTMYNLHLYKYENNKLEKISTYQSKNCSSSDKGGVFKSIEKMIMYIIRLNIPAVIFSNGIPKEKIVKNLLENYNIVSGQEFNVTTAERKWGGIMQNARHLSEKKLYFLDDVINEIELLDEYVYDAIKIIHSPFLILTINFKQGILKEMAISYR